MNIRIELYDIDVPCQPGAFLDIGCFQGLYTDALKGFFDYVYCFEPDIDSYTFLRYKYREDPKINVMNVAVGESCAEIAFNKNRISGACSTRFTDPREETSRAYYDSVTVSMITIDSLNIPNIRLVKIDTEGSELNIIKGCLETIGASHPMLLIEIHEHLCPNAFNEIVAILEKFNYSIRKILNPAYYGHIVYGAYTSSELLNKHFHIVAT